MKVSIIGASLAGLYLGYLLAREGVKVEIYEKERNGQAFKRTLIVTAKIKEVLDFDLSDSVINQVNRYELIADGERTAIQLEHPELVIERKALLEVLARRAEEAGVKIFWGHEVIGVSQKNLGQFADQSPKIFSLQIRDQASGKEKRINRDFIVLANGLSANLNENNKLALVQARVFFPQKKGKNKNPHNFCIAEDDLHKERRSTTCRVWFDARRTRYFFWLIPESAEVAAVGLIDEDMSKANDLLRLFLQEQRLQPIEFQAALVPEYKAQLSRLDSQSFGLTRKIGKLTAAKVEAKKVLFNDWILNCLINEEAKTKIACRSINGRGIYAVGDAAAQVKMTTVGGVVAGLRGAKAVAAAILQDYHRRQQFKRNFIFNHCRLNQQGQKVGNPQKMDDNSRVNSDLNYKQGLRALYWELNLHYFLRQLLNRFTNEDYARLLRKVEQDEELKAMLGRWCRDDLSSFLFKLLWRRPWLLLFALRKMVLPGSTTNLK